MTSADFLVYRNRIYSKTSSGKSIFFPSIPATSTKMKSSVKMKLRSIAVFGLHIDVNTHPFIYASYVVPVRQYQLLQSCFLQF